MGDLLTIGELAEVTTHPLRHYDDVGLVPATTRVSGRRRYDADAEIACGCQSLTGCERHESLA